MSQETYNELISVLDRAGVSYRLIDHPAEGRTEIVSALRGHETRFAAKCMVLLLKLGKKSTRYLLAVVPGNRRVNMNAVKALFGATYVSFASPEIAERMGRCQTGTILPFSFTEELEVVADPSLQKGELLYFNAARLDRSIEMRTEDYLALANPRLEAIAQPE